MNVTLSVNGRFHSFDVARELHRRGALARLITSYPAFVAERWELPRSKLRTLPYIELLKRAGSRARLPVERLGSPYDLLASRLVPPDTHVVESWSGSSLHTIRRARALGARSVVKRSSAHIVTQRELLEEESRRWGGQRHPVSAFIVERELREYEEADYVLASSEFVARTFRERGFAAEKLLCLPLAVDTARFRPQPREHRPFRVLFCGSASLRKGAPYLLQAFSELRLAGAELWFVGSVSGEVRSLLSRFSGPWLRLHEHVPQHELAHIYAQCDVLCLPSIEDGFGTVVTQAMACGLPVIVTENVGAAGSLDADVGYTLPIRDVEALKRAIEELYRDRERCRAMGQAAAARVREGGSWGAYTERLLALYRAICATSSTSAAELIAT